MDSNKNWARCRPMDGLKNHCLAHCDSSKQTTAKTGIFVSIAIVSDGLSEIRKFERNKQTVIGAIHLVYRQMD